MSRTYSADADACGQEHLARVELDRPGDRLADLLGEIPAGPVPAGRRIDDHAELIARQACASVSSWTDEVLQPARHGEQQAVADRVAEAVIDVLEPVDVDHGDEQLEAVVGLGAAHGALEPVHEQRTIGQAGETVLDRVIQHALLGALRRW